MSQYLSLHIFDASYSLDAHADINPLLKPESLRRLAWSVFYLDTMADAGVHGMHQTTERSYHIQLPCEETDFLRSSKVVTPLLSDIMTDMRSLFARDPGMRDRMERLGLSAFIIRTGAMRRRILHFASKLRWPGPTIQELVAQSDCMEEELKAMLDQLPSSLEYSEDNLYVHSTQQAAFILLHILQHNCCLMLARARLLISALQPHGAPELAVVARKDRLQHAFACSRVVSDALQMDVQCDDFVGTASYTCLEGENWTGFYLLTTSAPLRARATCSRAGHARIYKQGSDHGGVATVDGDDPKASCVEHNITPAGWSAEDSIR